MRIVAGFPHSPLVMYYSLLLTIDIMQIIDVEKVIDEMHSTMTVSYHDDHIVILQVIRLRIGEVCSRIMFTE